MIRFGSIIMSSSSKIEWLNCVNLNIFDCFSVLLSKFYSANYNIDKVQPQFYSLPVTKDQSRSKKVQFHSVSFAMPTSVVAKVWVGGKKTRNNHYFQKQYYYRVWIEFIWGAISSDYRHLKLHMKKQGKGNRLLHR